MTEARVFSSDVAFTPSVKAIQARKGSRGAYGRLEEAGGWATEIDTSLAQFIAAQTSVFLATASTEGQPYVQHRGGPPGFLKVLDMTTIGFIDFTGNRQFITQGNLAENPRAQLFLIDYASRSRVKIWGKATVVQGDKDLTVKLMPPDYKARAEQVILFRVKAWDANCPQHIPTRVEVADAVALLAERDRRIRELEAELARLQSGSSANLVKV